jgi:hypothetical protein
MSMSSDDVIPLNREGVLRVHLVPDAQLAGIHETHASWDGLPELLLDLAGEAQGLPNGTPVAVMATVEGDTKFASQTTATLHVPAYQPGTLTRFPCTLQARIDLTACRALGKQVRLEITLTPAHPNRVQFVLHCEANLECTLDIVGLKSASIGSEVTLTPSMAPLLARTHARVIMQEIDGPRADDPDDATLALEDGVQERPTPAGQPWTAIEWTREDLAASTKRSRIWRVGCAGQDPLLEYLQPSEVDGFEFEVRLELSFDEGAHYTPAAFTVPDPRKEAPKEVRWGVTENVPRPRLQTFALSRSSAEQVEVNVQIGGFAPGFKVPVIVDLWLLGKNPAGANVFKKLTTSPLDLVGGALQANLADCRKLRPGSSMYATLRLAREATLKSCLAAAHWLEYDKPFKTAKDAAVQSVTHKL